VIPLLLHQTWRSQRVRGPWARWQRTWIELHPSWAYRLWTDADIKEFVVDRFPRLARPFEALPKAIMRVDVFRAMLLAELGGIYVDMDVQCLRAIDPLLAGHQCLIATEPREHARALYGLDWLPSNAFLASVPGHPFWRHYLACIFDGSTPGNDPVAVTGPLRLRQAIDSYGSGREEITLLEPGLICPLADARNEKLAGQGTVSSNWRADLARELPGAYAVHWWAHSWIPSLWLYRLAARARALLGGALARRAAGVRRANRGR
jgi:mannosyltransferase OCH1-like enzyme